MVHHLRRVVDQGWCMQKHQVSNTSSGSTTSTWKWTKTRAHPQGICGPSEARSTSKGRRRRRSLRRIQVVIEYRGGPECSYLVTGSGATWRYPGSWYLHDVFAHFTNLPMDG